MTGLQRSGAAAFAACVFLAAAGGVRADSTLYTIGAPIDVVLTQRVSSDTAHVGDPFYFKTSQDVHLGTIDLPAGTPGTGRLATVVAATRSAPGQLALQADSVTSAAATVWVNIDTTVTPRGHFSSSRDIILDPGMTFRVITIVPRKSDAPLVETETPTPEPTLSPSPSATPMPVPSPTLSAPEMVPSESPSVAPVASPTA